MLRTTAQAQALTRPEFLKSRKRYVVKLEEDFKNEHCNTLRHYEQKELEVSCERDTERYLEDGKNKIRSEDEILNYLRHQEDRISKSEEFRSHIKKETEAAKAYFVECEMLKYDDAELGRLHLLGEFGNIKTFKRVHTKASKFI